MPVVDGVAQNEGDVNARLPWPTESAFALLQMIRAWPKDDCAFHELSPAWTKAHRDADPGGVGMGLALRELTLRGLVGPCRDKTGLVSCLEVIDEEKVRWYLGEAEFKPQSSPRSRPSVLAARIAA